MHCDEMGWLLGFIFDLFAQLDDVIVNGSGVDRVGSPPRLGKKCLAADHLAQSAGKNPENLK